ncbi:MAG: hypothetical protein E2O82_04095 [Betaproteobacteria bacterium]|nr:MAG: hypothetical protein E2O82_04095 [Betaproteobacteria bacterium]
MGEANSEQNKIETPTMKRSTFFQEDNGNLSSMRLMCFISLIASVLFGVLTIYTGNQDGIIITFGFLLGCFAPKAVQKFTEQKVKPREKVNNK